MHARRPRLTYFQLGLDLSDNIPLVFVFLWYLSEAAECRAKSAKRTLDNIFAETE